ncbi:chromosome partitioning protein [Streptomyces sp. 3MP-14]|uniref:Chromosome partitioning protein n=1 Tax=Streptomyces mimosae TaxID=2586635 RepID=A0A5N6AE18_9ACTN|nr:MULTISPECIES: chromosome partitioning protein [Streptomyces]KAB8166432.1 chromosome partitioning protein [Streptomyces mimosae]KAB8178862.1 chromosome partitioning protein [Streptomyces sp. 3MP-14]
MTVVALCSLKGAPGVTTSAVAMAAGWPAGGQPVVVECDPAGGDLMARYRLELNPGLVTLAAAGRRAGEDAGLIWQHTQRLSGGLPVVAGPPAAGQARAALGELTVGPHGSLLRRATSRPGVAVIADCGRVDADSPALDVVREADVLLLVAGATDEALAHLAVMVRPVAGWSRRPRLVLVGPGYPTDEITQALGTDELGVHVAGRIPHDPAGARAFGGQPAPRSAPGRSRLGRAAAELAARVARDALAVAVPTGDSPAPDQPEGANTVPNATHRIPR